MKNPKNAPLLPDGRRLAAPSWVKPGTLAENCLFLANRVNEAGLLFLESTACLRYTEEELPEALAGLPLDWHVHLPLDLDWNQPEQSAAICLRLMDKLRFLDVRRAVLHPPALARKGKTGPLPFGNTLRPLEIFTSMWADAGRNTHDILLENQPCHAPIRLADAAASLSCSICFDLAHFLLHNETIGIKIAAQQAGLEQMAELTRLLHLCAPEPPLPGEKRGGHAPLGDLAGEQREMACKLCRAAGPETIFMLEMFSWSDIADSLPVLRGWLAGGGDGN